MAGPRTIGKWVGASHGESAAFVLHIVLIAPEVSVRYRCHALTAEIGEDI
jgi:hypothetical protein